MTIEKPARFAVLLLALMLAALNLRPALTSVAPLLERIIAELSLSGAVAGLVTTIPVLLMGLLAPLAPVLARRWTLERVLAATLLLLALSLGLRAFSDSHVGWLLLSAFGAGISIAIAGPLMSGFIKQHFSHNMGLVIAAYSVSLTAGAAIAVVATLPLTAAMGGHWSWALASWALLAVGALIVWCCAVPMPARHANRAAAAEPLPLRSRQAWLFTLFFGCQSGIFYALSTWIVARYEQVGVSASQASGYASLFMGFGIVGAFLLPLLVGRVQDRRWLLMGVTATSMVSIMLIAWQPGWMPWLVNSIIGTTSAGTFALVLALPVLETDNPGQAASLTSMMSCVGYLLGGGVPALVGIGRDLTGGYALPFTLLAGLAGVMVIISFLLAAAPQATTNAAS